MDIQRATHTDIPARLDRLPWSRFHWLVVAALFLLNIEVFQPIARLAEGAKRVRTGDFHVRAESTGADEIGQLGPREARDLRRHLGRRAGRHRPTVARRAAL